MAMNAASDGQANTVRIPALATASTEHSIICVHGESQCGRSSVHSTPRPRALRRNMAIVTAGPEKITGPPARRPVKADRKRSGQGKA